MSRFTTPVLRGLLIFGLFLAVWPVATARAQDRPRSDTGRSRVEPPPPPPVTAQDEPVRTDWRPAGNWFLVMNGGFAGGTDLFRAETVSGAPVLWPGSPFPTDRFNAKVGSGISLGLGVGRRVGDLVNLRLDLNWTEVDVAAESAVGQVGELFTYDDLGIWEIVLGGEVRLARQASTPYLGLGAVLQGISAAQAEDLDQTGVGARIAMGYRLAVAEVWSLRLEGRLTYAPFDASNHHPQTQPSTEVLITSQDSHTLWQLVVGVQMEL